MKFKKKKILYKDWIYEWLIEKKEYIKESTYANYSNNVLEIEYNNKGQIKKLSINKEEIKLIRLAIKF